MTSTPTHPLFALFLGSVLALPACGGGGGGGATGDATDASGTTAFETTTPGGGTSSRGGDGGPTGDASTGGSESDTATGGSQDAGTGGSHDAATGGGQDAATGGGQDAATGGGQDTGTGGSQDTGTGGSQDTGNPVADTGGSEDAAVGDDTAAVEDAGTTPGDDTSDPGGEDSGSGAEPDEGPGVDDVNAVEDVTDDTVGSVDAGPEETTEPDLPPPCEPECDDKACGPDGCGGVCGECGPGTSCEPTTGVCALEDQAGKDGAWCGESPACLPTTPDPATGAPVANPSYPACLDAQCDSGLCLMNPAPGAFVFMPTCSKPCTITKDEVNNLTNIGAPDGVEDLDAPQSDCAGFVDGPAGDQWRCVEFAPPGSGQSAAYCLPGSTFHTCDHDLDCLPGDGCSTTQIGGLVNNRCLSLLQTGPWGEYGTAGQSCAESSFCESGLCFPATGCGPFCVGDSDCDTTAGNDDAGCDLATGTCKGWADQPCSNDAHCSAWFCDGPTEIFTGVADYTPQVCQPNVCDTALDCPDDFYCRWFWNGLSGPAADWEHRCLEGTEGGSPQGGACDPAGGEPLCQATDLCVGGYCAGVCETDAECVAEAGQKCVINEVPLDIDGDGATDQLLPLEFCATFPVQDGPCVSETDCGPEFTCTMVEVENDDDPVVPYTMEGVCTLASPEDGSWGDVCGLPDTEGVFETCEAFCFGADPATNAAGFCSQTCESAADCPTVNLLGTEYTGRCGARLFGWSLDQSEVGNNLFVSLCLVNPPGSSGADCSATLSCAAPNEACTPEVITFGPDYPWTIDYVCLDKSSGGSPPTTPVGGVCDPSAPVDPCMTAFCLPDATGTSGVCTAPCDPGNDTCGGGLSCQPWVWQQKLGELASESVVLPLCQP